MTGGGPSDPLVGGLCWRTRIRGSVVVLTHDDGSRTSLRTVDGQCVGPEGRPGVNPVYSILVRCCLAQVSFPPLSSPGVVETRRLELLTLSLQRRCSAN
jgi:hypothetical protein